MNRRQSLTTLAGLAALSLNGHAAPTAPRREICCFTKIFQPLTFPELAQTVAEIGCDGVEATIRPTGHIEPEAVPDQLPKLVEALAAKKIALTILASGINEISADQHTETVLRTATELGIKRYRMAYYHYDENRPLRQQLADFKSKLADLSALNKELGIQALYQNHAGANFCGSSIWDIASIMEDLPREAVSLAFDIRHATVEGGMSWPTLTRLALPLSGSVYVKDFQWSDSLSPKNVPLGEGRVQKSFFDQLKDFPLSCPISLHVEYVEPKDKNAVARATKAYQNDLATLRTLLPSS